MRSQLNDTTLKLSFVIWRDTCALNIAKCTSNSVLLENHPYDLATICFLLTVTAGTAFRFGVSTLTFHTKMIARCESKDTAISAINKNNSAILESLISS